MQRRRRKREEEDINQDEWINTYADTITLLLTFFILLYSFSLVDQEKLNKISASFENILGTGISASEKDRLTGLIEVPSTSNTAYEDLVLKVNTLLKENGLEDIVRVREEDTGVVLQLNESILFDPAKANLKEESYEILSVISDIIPQIDNNIMVQGHTDNVPINTEKYDSNWELSTARATQVLRYFVESKGFDPERFSATGYGEYKPLVDNDTSENKATNRRVDILIVQKKEIEN